MELRKIIVMLVLVGLLSAVCVSALAQEPQPVKVSGYMLNRGYIAPGSNMQFNAERISLSVLGTLPENRNAYVEWYYHPWAPASGLYQESAYFDTPLGDGRLRIGKGRGLTFGMTPAYPNRKTSNYGIVAEAFTQDRVQGLQYYSQKGPIDLGLAVRTGMRLGTRAIGELSGDAVRNKTHTVPHLCFRDLTDSLSNKLDVTVRVGGKWPNGLNAGVSYLYGTLDARDVTNLTTSSATNPLSPGATPALIAPTTNDDRRVLGFDLMYKLPSGFVVQGELYDGKMSTLDFDAWNVLAGYEPAGQWKFYVRYAEQNMGATPTANKLSWDTQQTSLSAVQPLGKGLWLQYEYEINNESPAPGEDKVDNNLFFVELFSAF